jgi:hypothetical protein
MSDEFRPRVRISIICDALLFDWLGLCATTLPYQGTRSHIPILRSKVQCQYLITSQAYLLCSFANFSEQTDVARVLGSFRHCHLLALGQCDYESEMFDAIGNSALCQRIIKMLAADTIEAVAAL